MGTTLVVNPGSSSKKYALFKNGQPVLELRFESTDIGFEVCLVNNGSKQVCEAIKDEDFNLAFARVSEEVCNFLKQENVGQKLDSVVVRVVASGTAFQRHSEINSDYLNSLKKRQNLAPLHIPTIIREVENIQKYFPDIKIIAASDSDFHSTIPSSRQNFSIPKEDGEKYDIKRFGFHGLSVSSVVRKIHGVIGIDPEKMIVCHIGNGVSVTAVKNGKSVDTTMGFSPGTGLVMGTRAGDLDTGALLEIMRVKSLKPAEAEMYLNSMGGLYGLAGDADIRRLLDKRSKNDELSTQTLNTFAYHIQKAIAASTISIGGLDVLVLTATAAVRSTELRCLILNGLKHLGVEVSEDRNNSLVGKDGVISVRNSKVKVVVMRTDEMGEMALVGQQFLSSKI